MEVLPYVGGENKIDRFDLDLKDKKLLRILGNNARTPLTKIAKQIALSRDAVKYRIDSYFKKGILKGSRTIVNVKKFGYDSYHIFVNLRSQSESVEKKLIDQICKLSYTRAVLKFYGSYDLEIAVIARNTDELEKIVSEITEIIGEYAKDIEILTLTKSLRAGPFPESFLKENSFRKNETNNKNHKIDEKDLEILKLIRDFANISLLDIAEKLRISPDAAGYRLKNLVDAGHIIGFSYVLNYFSIKYDVYAVLFNFRSMKSEDENKLRNFFSSDKNVFWAVKCIGKFNVLTYFAVKQASELHDSIREIKSIFPEKLNNYETLSAFAEYKYTYAPDCIFR